MIDTIAVGWVVVCGKQIALGDNDDEDEDGDDDGSGRIE